MLGRYTVDRKEAGELVGNPGLGEEKWYSRYPAGGKGLLVGLKPVIVEEREKRCFCAEGGDRWEKSNGGM